MAKVLIALLVIGAASLLLTLATHVSVLLVRRRRRSDTPSFPISVLKPLKGEDPELYENLSSLARQDYPCFELVLGCEDPLDPALRTAFRVAREFPDVAIKVVCGGRQIGLNPKINNLFNIARSARYDHWLISDADVRVGSGYLRAIASEMLDPKVGLVSNVIAACSGGSLAAAIESLHVNTFISRSVCGADVLARQACVIGKSMLFRKSDLDRLGGLGVVKDVLAEDYVLGKLYREAGFRVVLSPYAVRTVNAPRPARELVNRHVRWSQMRCRLVPQLYWGEPLMMPALWWSLMLFILFLDPRAAGSSSHLFTRVAELSLAVLGLADALLVRELSGKSFDVKWALLGPLRDFAAVFTWAEGALRRTVVWRGNTFTIGAGSTLTPCSSSADVELARADRDAEVAEV
ncbi:MAG TPA: glycosyltransferase [Polyangiaceae bacterium]|nr:glycosyltransferase [Polyangiaceae bacterium]